MSPESLQTIITALVAILLLFQTTVLIWIFLHDECKVRFALLR
jgi:hypothetical protein